MTTKISAPTRAAKQPVVKRPAARSPAASGPVAKRTTAKRPVTKRPAAKSGAASEVAFVALLAPSAKPAKPAKPAKAPKPAKPANVTSPVKAAKPVKVRQKPVRDSFTMPEADFALIAALKARTLSAKRETKKSELLRAGLHALAALDTAGLLAALGALAPVKVGRPKAGH